MFERKLDVINRGFSGFNSENILYFLKDIFEEFDIGSIAGIAILLGTNDSTDKKNTLQHVPLEKFKENMITIINYLIGRGVKSNRIILISPPRIDDKKLQKVFGENKTHSDILVKDYAQVCRDIVGDLGVILVDINKTMHDEGDEKYKEYLSDGVHFSHAGGQFLFEKLKPILQENIDIDLEINFPFTDLPFFNNPTQKDSYSL